MARISRSSLSHLVPDWRYDKVEVEFVTRDGDVEEINPQTFPFLGWVDETAPDGVTRVVPAFLYDRTLVETVGTLNEPGRLLNQGETARLSSINLRENT